MDSELIEKLIFLTLTGIGGVAAFAAKAVIDMRIKARASLAGEASEKGAFLKYAERVEETYEHLLHIQHLGASRCLVLYTRNGGGIPRADKPLRLSVLRETYARESGSVKRVFQDVETDRAYDAMLHQLLKSDTGKIIVRARTMDEGMLKTNYERYGTAIAFIYYLKETSTMLHFVSFNFPTEELGKKHEYDCDMEAKALKRIFKNMSDAEIPAHD